MNILEKTICGHYLDMSFGLDSTSNYSTRDQKKYIEKELNIKISTNTVNRYLCLDLIIKNSIQTDKPLFLLIPSKEGSITDQTSPQSEILNLFYNRQSKASKLLLTKAKKFDYSPSNKNSMSKKELEKIENLENYFASQGDFSATEQYGATGFLEELQDLENETEEVANAKKIAFQEAFKKTEEAKLIVLAEWDKEQLDKGNKEKTRNQNASKKTKNRRRAKSKNESFINKSATNSKSTSPSTTTNQNKTSPTNLEVKKGTTPQPKENYSHYLETITAKNINTHAKEDDGDWINIPFAKTYQLMAKFLSSQKKYSTIYIPKDIEPVTCTQFNKVDFYATKEKKSGSNVWPIIEHLKTRHPDDLDFIRHNIDAKTSASTGHSDLEKITHLMQSVIEKSKPESVTESNYFISENEQKIPVNVLKISANITLGNKNKNVVCVFSKPRSEIIKTFNQNNENTLKHALVLRTMYFQE